MKLRTIDVTILLVLGLLCVSRATWGVFKDLKANLETAKSIVGKVTYSDIIKIDEATLKIDKKKTVFAFELENSNEKFAVDRGLTVCKYLKNQIKNGDTLLVFFRHGTNQYNRFVFQIEKGEKILASIKDYKKRETKLIVLCYAFGLLILGGLLIWFLTKNKVIRPIK